MKAEDKKKPEGKTSRTASLVVLGALLVVALLGGAALADRHPVLILLFGAADGAFIASVVWYCITDSYEDEPGTAEPVQE